MQLRVRVHTDVETAASARDALDGRSIPRHLLPEHIGSCHLHISYSAHIDRNMKFQSHRSRVLVKLRSQNTCYLGQLRDYTNPYLLVNPTSMEGLVQPVVGRDGKKQELQSNVLLASIENMQYAVTGEVLHTKIAIFEKNGEFKLLFNTLMLQLQQLQKKL